MAQEEYGISGIVPAASSQGLSRQLPTGQPGSPQGIERQYGGVWGQVAKAEQESPIGLPVANFISSFMQGRAAQTEKANRATIMQAYKQQQQQQQVKDVFSQAMDMFKVTKRNEDFQAVVQQLEGNPFGVAVMGITPQATGEFVKVIDADGNAFEVEQGTVNELRGKGVDWTTIIDQHGRMTDKAKQGAPDKLEIKTEGGGTRTDIYQDGVKIETVTGTPKATGAGGGGAGGGGASLNTPKKQARDYVDRLGKNLFFPQIEERLSKEKKRWSQFTDPLTDKIYYDKLEMEYPLEHRKILRNARKYSDKLTGNLGVAAAGEEGFRRAYFDVYGSDPPGFDPQPGAAPAAPAALAPAAAPGTAPAAAPVGTEAGQAIFKYLPD